MYRVAIHKVSQLFTNFFAIGSSISMFAVFLIVCVNSLRRYAIGKSVEWGEELPVFIAVYGFMFGAAYAYMQDRHIRFTVLVGFLPQSMTKKLFLLVDLLMILIGGFLSWSGWHFVNKRGGMESSGMINLAKSLKEITGWDNIIWLGHYYPYQAAIIFGGAILAIAALLKFLTRLTEPSEIEQVEC